MRAKAVESLHRWQREGRISHADMVVRKLEALRREGHISEAEHGRRRIEVSADGVTFVSAGDFSDDAGNIPIDLGALGLPFGSAIRITHVSGDLPGFDLDAVEALNVIDLGAVEIVLDPPTGENPGFTEHTVTANVDDGAPVAGVLVAFAVVDGPNDDSSIAPTDELGDAPFTWIGDEGPGLEGGADARTGFEDGGSG